MRIFLYNDIGNIGEPNYKEERVEFHVEYATANHRKDRTGFLIGICALCDSTNYEKGRLYEVVFSTDTGVFVDEWAPADFYYFIARRVAKGEEKTAIRAQNDGSIQYNIDGSAKGGWFTLSKP